MEAAMIDLSNLPASSVTEDDFFAWTVPNEIARLRRMHRAVGTWGDISAQELADYEVEMAAQHNSLWDAYAYDPVTDESMGHADTECAMYAVLGVAIASSAENFIRRICKRRGIPLIDDEGESHFGIICTNFNKSFGTQVSDLPGYKGNQRARILGNCFKHNSGETDERFKKKFKTPGGEEIEYETEKWDQMIDDTGTLLYEICALLSKPNKTIAPSSSIRKRLVRLIKRKFGA